MTFTFVTDGVESAIGQAVATAGDLAVTAAEGPARSDSFCERAWWTSCESTSFRC